MTHLQVDPPSYLKTPPLRGTLPRRRARRSARPRHPPPPGPPRASLRRPTSPSALSIRVLQATRVGYFTTALDMCTNLTAAEHDGTWATERPPPHRARRTALVVCRGFVCAAECGTRSAGLDDDGVGGFGPGEGSGGRGSSVRSSCRWPLSVAPQLSPSTRRTPGWPSGTAEHLHRRVVAITPVGLELIQDYFGIPPVVAGQPQNEVPAIVRD